MDDEELELSLEQGSMTQIEGTHLQTRAVEHLQAGVGDVIAMPNGPEDLDKDDLGSRTVLYVKATTLDGEVHELMMTDHHIGVLNEAVGDYLFLRAERENEAKGSPPEVTQLLDLLKGMRKLKNELENDVDE